MNSRKTERGDQFTSVSGRKFWASNFARKSQGKLGHLLKEFSLPSVSVQRGRAQQLQKCRNLLKNDKFAYWLKEALPVLAYARTSTDNLGCSRSKNPSWSFPRPIKIVKQLQASRIFIASVFMNWVCTTFNCVTLYFTSITSTDNEERIQLHVTSKNQAS